MRIFHLSDLHLGLKLMNRDLSEDQAYILDQITEDARREQPDAVVIAGDIYDKAIPPAEAVELFDRFVSELSEAVPEAEIMMISGNHDSAPRVNLFRSILSRRKIHMIGIPPRTPEDHIEKVVLTDQYGPVNFYLLPFVKPSAVKAVIGPDPKGNNYSYDETVRRLLDREAIDLSERNVLVSHQFYLPKGTAAEDVERAESEITTVGNIDQVGADVLAPFDYAALGHIHRAMKVGNEAFRYCGTPLACSVSEAGQQKGILEVTMGEKGQVSVDVLPLVPLREIRVIRGTLKEVLEQGCDDYVRAVLTDKTDLDVFDMQDRLRHAFPNLLEIRREGVRTADYSAEYTEEAALNPFELCCSYLKDLEEEEKELLREVINRAEEGRI